MKTFANDSINSYKHEVEDSLNPNITYNKVVTGLTKREYFAAMAMQGLAVDIKLTPYSEPLTIPTNVATWAVNFADALIKELNKENGQ